MYSIWARPVKPWFRVGREKLEVGPVTIFPITLLENLTKLKPSSASFHDSSAGRTDWLKHAQREIQLALKLPDFTRKPAFWSGGILYVTQKDGLPMNISLCFLTNIDFGVYMGTPPNEKAEGVANAHRP